ncbi:MAG: hypothetical protein GX994_05210 [Firmicutes bacterium]|nr:hypothetical protein [Bacillota bacterium]
MRVIDNLPYSFNYQRPYIIEKIYEHWRETGQWWLGESELYVYQVIAENNLFELHYRLDKCRWILYRIYD